MTPAEAAEQWARAKRIIQAATPELEAAEDVLKAHFRRTKRTEYKGMIGYAVSTYQRLDTKSAKAMLGAKAPMVPSRRETLSLLQ